jgi:hypothetical protein
MCFAQFYSNSRSDTHNLFNFCRRSRLRIRNSNSCHQKNEPLLHPQCKERMLNELDDPWCRSLHECTVCLRDNYAKDADTCLAYLGVLEQQLEREMIHNGGFDFDDENDEDDEDNDGAGNHAPSNHPPSWRQFLSIVAQTADLDLTMNRVWTEETTTQQQKQHQINSRHFPSRLRLSVQRLVTRISPSNRKSLP